MIVQITLVTKKKVAWLIPFIFLKETLLDFHFWIN